MIKPLIQTPLCISKISIPDISITVPDNFLFKIPDGWIPSISIPPIIFEQPQCLDKKEEIGMEISKEEKSAAILQKIVEIINKGENVTFKYDWGNYTATITKGDKHSHVGIPSKDGSFEIFINNLYGLLVKGEGLSWE